MEDQPNRSSYWITVAVALPVLYVLSIGPVLWMIVKPLHTIMAPMWFMYLYFPVIWLTEVWPAFKAILDAYLKLWGL